MLVAPALPRALRRLLVPLAAVAVMLGLVAAPASAATVPGRTSGVVATPGSAAITVAWVAPATGGSAITAYQVSYRSYLKTTKTWTAWAAVTVASSARTKTVSAVNGRTYQARVRARNAVGYGTWSSVASVIAGTPKAPSPSSVTSGNGRLVLAWGASLSNGAAVTSYQAQARVYSTATKKWGAWSTKTFKPTVRSAAVLGANGTLWQTQVRATNSRGAGPFTALATTRIGLPAAVTGTKATVTGTTATVTWTAANGNGSPVTSYLVWSRGRATAGDAWGAWTSKSVLAPAVTTDFASLVPGSDQQYYVRAINKWGTGPAGATVLVHVPAPPPGLGTVAAGNEHACAITSTGGLQCWGRGLEGELGTGTKDNSTVPVDVAGLTSGVVSVSAGFNYTCAVVTGGAVKCWGENNTGQIGNGVAPTSSIDPALYVLSPTDVQGLPGPAVAVSAGRYHACALMQDKTIACWGENDHGQLGDQTQVTRLTAVAVSGISNATAVAAGSSFTCALVSGGEQCWGDGRTGVLGTGQTFDDPNSYSLTPVTPTGLDTGVTSITAGFFSACAVKDGATYCWGQNSYGQLGVGGLSPRNVPTALPTAATSVDMVSSGNAGACRVRAGLAECWGAYPYLGYGQLTDYVTVPYAPAGGLTGVVDVSAGEGLVCARLDSGEVWCWGNPGGFVGDGTTGAEPGNYYYPHHVTGF